MEEFSKLISQARAFHGGYLQAWEAIRKMPRQCVLDNVEKEVDKILANNDEADYWMFLRFYAELDKNLYLKLCDRIRSHSNFEIRELLEA